MLGSIKCSDTTYIYIIIVSGFVMQYYYNYQGLMDAVGLMNILCMIVCVCLDSVYIITS